MTTINSIDFQEIELLKKLVTKACSRVEITEYQSAYPVSNYFLKFKLDKHEVEVRWNDRDKFGIYRHKHGSYEDPVDFHNTAGECTENVMAKLLNKK